MNNTILYDSKRIFLSGGSGGGGGDPVSADKVSINIETSGELSQAKDVQTAIQMMADGMGGVIDGLPKDNLPNNAKVNEIIKCVNEILDAFRQNIKEEQNEEG